MVRTLPVLEIMCARVIAVMLVLLTLVGRRMLAEAATEIVLTGDAGDPVGNGVTYRFDFNISAVHPTPSSVRVDFSEPSSFFSSDWSFFFATSGAPLTAGAYEDASRGPSHAAGDPTLAVGVRGVEPCTNIVGRFDVHEVTYGTGEDVESFSADFELHCDGATTAFRGAIRFRTGDATCIVGLDGGACDDGDACSSVSRCVGGECVGTEMTVCPGEVDRCEPPVCHPGTGQCLPPATARDGAPCDDGDPCTAGDACSGGVCTPSRAADCDDHDGCTDDFCRPRQGCDHAPLPGVCDTPGTPSTMLFIDRLPRGLASGLQERVTAADGYLTVSAVNSVAPGVEVSFWGEQPVTVAFYPPAGQTLVPGVYDGAVGYAYTNPTRPALELVIGGLDCDPRGRFIVREASFGPGGEVIAFAADFEQHCAGEDPRLFGAVRYHTGDAACRSAPEGSPCDPGDACIGRAECRQGICVGLDAVTCPSPEPCHEAPVCDPTIGACLTALSKLDLTPCIDPSVCSTDAVCKDGRCVATAPAECSDSNVCTDDRCDPIRGCTHEPIAGTCWELRGETTIVATALGRSCACTYRSGNGVLALANDGTFRSPGGTCPSQPSLAIPEEVGTWHPGGRGRLVLETSNLAELTGAVEACAGGSSDLRVYRTWVKPSPDGKRLRGVHHDRARGAGVVVDSITHFTGRPGDGVVSRMRSSVAHCVQEIVSCLRNG